MAPTPYLLFGAAPEDTPASADVPRNVVPDLSDAVARPRLRRQAASGPGRQEATSGGGGGVAAPPKKTPQRGLGVAELERLRCGGVDPLHDINAATAAAMLQAAAVNMQAQSNSLLLQQQQHHHQDYLPAFDAATGSRYYSPLLVQPPPAAPAPVRYVQGVAPEQQYFMDRWGRMGGFVPASNGHQPQLQVPASTTIWRPACSSASCPHAGQRCDLCSKTTVDLSDDGTRALAAAATINAPDYSVYNLAAAMTAARKETAGAGFLVAPPEGRKEVREIEFFPTTVTSHGGGPDESELRRTPTPSSSSPPGGVGGSLDLSLRL